jgi:hypothetical protein
MSLLNNGQITGVQRFIDAAEDDRGGLGAFNAAFGNSAEAFLGSRTPGRDNKIHANWKDRLFGHSTDELTEEYYKKREMDLANDPKIGKFLHDSGNTIDVTSKDSKLYSDAGKYAKTEKLRSDFGQLGYMIPSSFKTEESVLAEGLRQKKEDQTTPTNLAINERDYTRTQAAEDKRTNQSRYLDLMEQNIANRQFQQMQSQNNFQLQMGQMGMNNRRLDMENARSNRRDQREALALILQGLTNVSNNLVNY